MSRHIRTLFAALFVVTAALFVVAPVIASAAPAPGQVSALSAVRSVKGVQLGSNGATLSVDVAGGLHSVAVDFASFLPSEVTGSVAQGTQGRTVAGALTIAFVVFAFGWFRRMVSVFARIGHRPMR